MARRRSLLVRLAHEIGALWRRLRREDVDLPLDRAIIHHVLDPSFLRSQLERVQEAGAGLLDGDSYEEMYAELDTARETRRSGADPTQGTEAYLPRSPGVSLLQSALTECIVSRFEDLVRPLPAGHRSFAEFELRIEDVFRPFGPCDVRWIECVISKGLSLFHRLPPFPDRPPDVPLADDGRIVVVGDWGTGLSRARAVGLEMEKRIEEALRQGRQVHALHLGDVYYSGWKEEYRARFMPSWPVRGAREGVLSWALNGNHDMYSGGHGYFGYLLRDPRFGGQEGSSHFCLESSHWQLLGLDTSYQEEDLAGRQGDWVAGKLRSSSRKTMLLTHHQPYSAFDEVDPPLLGKLEPAFEIRPVDAWIWGHEHRCCVYEPSFRPYVRFGSCIGHGGVPALVPRGPPPAGVRWHFDEYELHEGQDRWQLFGFAVLDFAGPAIDVSYFDQRGNLNYQDRVG
jgi:hypothetical protein